MSNIIKNVFFHATLDCNNLSPVGKFFYGFADFDMDKQVKDQIIDMIVAGRSFEGFDRCRVTNFQLTAFTPLPTHRERAGGEVEPESTPGSHADIARKSDKLCEALERKIDGLADSLQRKVASELVVRLRGVITYGQSADNLISHITTTISELQNLRQRIRDSGRDD